MPEPIPEVKETPETPTPENLTIPGQETPPDNNGGVKTEVPQTPEVQKEISVAEFFAGILGEDQPPEDKPKVDEPAKEKPADVPSDNGAKVVELENQMKEKDAALEKYKPIGELLEKDPTFAAFIKGLTSGKITFEGVFQQFVKAQSTKTPAAPSGSGGSAPKQTTLSERLQNISQKKQTDDNSRRW